MKSLMPPRIVLLINLFRPAVAYLEDCCKKRYLQMHANLNCTLRFRNIKNCGGFTMAAMALPVDITPSDIESNMPLLFMAGLD